MKKIEVRKIMNIQCKIKEILANINCYLKVTQKNNSKNRSINNQINILNLNESEKYKMALLFQMHTGNKLF